MERNKNILQEEKQIVEEKTEEINKFCKKRKERQETIEEMESVGEEEDENTSGIDDKAKKGNEIQYKD